MLLMPMIPELIFTLSLNNKSGLLSINFAIKLILFTDSFMIKAFTEN